MTSAHDQDERKGLIFGLVAYGLWGLFPLYWPLLKPASATEILAHRMAWSLLVIMVILAVRRDLSWIGQLRRTPRKALLLVLAATVVSVNWGMYIWAVNKGQVVETSLGYFINPLVTVLFGVLILHERLRPLQWAAVAVGAASIAELVIGYGHVPWIALILAFSFGSYGLFKKLASVPAVESMAVETGYQFIPALGYLAFLQAQGTATFGHTRWITTVLLACAGLVTVIPLLCFAAAANRLPLSTMGLLQFLAPILQLSCGVFIAHETVPGTEWIGFGIVWIALALFTYDSLQHSRSKNSKARASQPVPVAAVAVLNTPSLERAGESA
ncbi:MAG TPA: EamA family transporter RarD [Actinocrinis sp.]|uniref:EamA family transporter RarD n=1 Tax=Actinocrinis sp. TaxID=1920516 RepID=UPI002DDD7904|nr:EamA family transporter RarD [Actinocrinis sp.]HEV2345671.1 EamA family transporter RarD [Actinocrinis sp.]